MAKKDYELPALEVSRIGDTDVITTSPEGIITPEDKW